MSPASAYLKVAVAASELGTAYLKPIYERLDESVPYDQIRIVVAHLERFASSSPTSK